MASWNEIEIGNRSSYDGQEQIYGPIPDALAKVPVEYFGEGATTVVVLGQSNAANFAAGRYTAQGNVTNFSLYDGKCYHAVDPLVGASGDGGNFATRLGDILILRGLADRVILAPIGMGNTRIEDWAPGGIFHHRILVLIRRLYEARLKPDLILWQQGEGNKSDYDPGGRRYCGHLLDIVHTFRSYGVNAPFLIALCTLCGDAHPNAMYVREGQRGAVNPNLRTFLGPDTDLIGPEDRFDGCHMSEGGAQRQAEIWADAIASIVPT